MKEKEFDYYIFLDYSDNLIGYIILEKAYISEIISLITKIKHYKNVKHKKLYLKSIRKIIYSKELISKIYKLKIQHMRHNLELFTEILEFLKSHHNSIIFASIDDNQYISFERLLHIIYKNITLRRESELKKGSIEYKLSLIIDNILNIERMSK